MARHRRGGEVRAGRRRFGGGERPETLLAVFPREEE
jgi:hypothetical protein